MVAVTVLVAVAASIPGGPMTASKKMTRDRVVGNALLSWPHRLT
jgi:hypothetical protein